MDCFVIQGGAPLSGRVAAAGSKNAALPLLAASLLVEGESHFRRVPALRDLDTMAELLEGLGAGIRRRGAALAVEARAEGPTEAPYEVVRRMRASVCVLGPLLARRGRARVALPGGCVLGARPIDLHLKGLAALGAEIRIEHGTVVAEAPPGGLRGASVFLAAGHGSTVLGTANVLMAACLARGTSVIDAAAMEPEIQDVARFLVACGARIEGIGGPRLVVEGVEGLRATAWEVPPDRMEVGTLLLAGAATRGDVTVERARPAELGAVIDLLQRSGVPVEVESGGGAGGLEGSIRVRPWERRPRALDVTARPYPGFPTDLQAQWMTFCTMGDGLALVIDSVYPDRFMHVAELNRLGAEIRREGRTAIVFGPRRLSGAPVLASDLRASAALVMAGLLAEGQTVVRRVYHLDRGYERLEEKLVALGANVSRVVDEGPP